MKAVAASLIRSQSASSAAEFALVLPALLVLLLGIIDVGRYSWTLNLAEKATQMGARYAVVSDPAANAINTDYVNLGVPGGDPVPTTTFDNAVCDDTDCTVAGTSGVDTSRNGTAFNNIVAWMQKFYPGVSPEQVTVSYKNVGLGYSGDPYGPNVAALTTVELSGLKFYPLILFGYSVDLPPVKASLTLEDGECSATGDCGSSN